MTLLEVGIWIFEKVIHMKREGQRTGGRLKKLEGGGRIKAKVRGLKS